MADPTLRDMLLARSRTKENGTIGQPYRPPMMQGIGTLADLINAFAQQSDRVGLTMPQWSPVAPGKSMTLRDLTVGNLGNVLENISYGMGPMRGGNFATGGLGTMGQVDPQALELANAIPLATLAVKGLVKGGRMIAPTMEDVLRKKSESLINKSGGRMYAVPPADKFFQESKAVMSDGSPMILYHGSPEKGLKTIQPGQREPGAWFTRDIGYANQYAKSHEGEIYKAHLNIRKPLVVRFQDTREGVRPFVDGKPLDVDNNIDVVKFAKAKGYDGVHFPDGNFSEDSETWVALSPDQIRLIK